MGEIPRVTQTKVKNLLQGTMTVKVVVTDLKWWSFKRRLGMRIAKLGLNIAGLDYEHVEAFDKLNEGLADMEDKMRNIEIDPLSNVKDDLTEQ